MHHQSRRSYRAPAARCHKMDRMLIIVVELNLGRDPLLTHEYADANRESAPLCLVGKHLFYLKRHLSALSETQRIGSYEREIQLGAQSYLRCESSQLGPARESGIDGCCRSRG